MIMAQKHLHDLLKEDQEPFHLKTYIAHRRSQLKTPSPKTLLQVKKRKTIVESSTTNSSLCTQACFFSFHDSPDFRKSPIPDFMSPAAKSPCKSSNTVFLHIPARTAALLLEAAIRIQKHSSSSSKPKTQIKNAGFGLFGSILKRFKDRSRTKKLEINDNGFRVSANNSSENFEEIEFVNHFRSSPFPCSPQKSPSFCHRTPDFLSPATSPGCHTRQEKENYEAEGLQEIQVGEEEEKEQCSPVSVLDLPFEEGDGGQHEVADEEDDYDLEYSSYANVQRTKQQLLQKLCRFEKLANLDPIELERSIYEEEEDIDDQAEEEECEDDESLSAYKAENVDKFVRDILSRSDSHHRLRKITADEKRPVLDLVLKERKKQENGSNNYEIMAKGIWKTLDLELESNTINMIIELDLRNEVDGWTKYVEEVGEMAMEIELAIFGQLMEESSEEF